MVDETSEESSLRRRNSAESLDGNADDGSNEVEAHVRDSLSDIQNERKSGFLDSLFTDDGAPPFSQSPLVWSKKLCLLILAVSVFAFCYDFIYRLEWTLAPRNNIPRVFSWFTLCSTMWPLLVYVCFKIPERYDKWWRLVGIPTLPWWTVATVLYIISWITDTASESLINVFIPVFCLYTVYGLKFDWNVKGRFGVVNVIFNQFAVIVLFPYVAINNPLLMPLALSFVETFFVTVHVPAITPYVRNKMGVFVGVWVMTTVFDAFRFLAWVVVVGRWLNNTAGFEALVSQILMNVVFQAACTTNANNVLTYYLYGVMGMPYDPNAEDIDTSCICDRSLKLVESIPRLLNTGTWIASWTVPMLFTSVILVQYIVDHPERYGTMMQFLAGHWGLVMLLYVVQELLGEMACQLVDKLLIKYNHPPRQNFLSAMENVYESHSHGLYPLVCAMVYQVIMGSYAADVLGSLEL